MVIVVLTPMGRDEELKFAWGNHLILFLVPSCLQFKCLGPPYCPHHTAQHDVEHAMWNPRACCGRPHSGTAAVRLDDRRAFAMPARALNVNSHGEGSCRFCIVMDSLWHYLVSSCRADPSLLIPESAR